ncbi:MAG TPA: hypothetical protein VI685_14230 [Candidatus Angelobacter sp.]
MGHSASLRQVADFRLLNSPAAERHNNHVLSDRLNFSSAAIARQRLAASAALPDSAAV